MGENVRHFFRPFVDPPQERDEEFSDHPYQQNLSYYEQAHASKSIKNNLKLTELMTDPSYAYQSKRVCLNHGFLRVCLSFSR